MTVFKKKLVENFPSGLGNIVPSKIWTLLGFITLNFNPSNGIILLVTAEKVTVWPGMYSAFSVPIESSLCKASSSCTTVSPREKEDSSVAPA